MKMKGLLAGALLASLLVGIDEGGAVEVRGLRDCGAWVKNRSAVGAAAILKGGDETWLTGFMSGLAVQADKEFWNNPFITNDQLFLWMDNWCRANPLTSVGEAAVRLFNSRTK